MGKGLEIVHLNVRSLYKNIDEICVHYDAYDILFSETWLHKGIVRQGHLDSQEGGWPSDIY